MADNTTLNTGSGGDVIRDKDRTGVKTQIVALDLNPAGSESLMAGAMPVTDNSGSLTVDNAGTFAVQARLDTANAPASTTMQNAATSTGNGTVLSVAGFATAVVQLSGTWVATITFEASVDNTNFFAINAHGIGTDTVASTATTTGDYVVSVAGFQQLRARISSYTSGSVTAAGYPTVLVKEAYIVRDNLIQLNGTTVDTNSGNKSAGTLRVVLATDQPQNTTALKVDGSAVTQPVSGTVTASNAAGDIAHDSVDSGNPVKVGGKAANAFPTAVANADRANMITDLFGRLMTTHIDPAQQTWKQVEATSTQTGTAIWTPTTGKKIAVTGYYITTGGTTAGTVTLWFGDSADTTFTQGTDQVLWRGEVAPSSTSRPFINVALSTPAFCTTADRILRYTTSAGITIYITVYGYEF